MDKLKKNTKLNINDSNSDSSMTNPEFGFELELIKANETKPKINIKPINSAMYISYKNKVFRNNPYNDLMNFDIKFDNKQGLKKTDEFLSGEARAKALCETLKDRSTFIKTPLIGDIIIDYDLDKDETKRRYDNISELINNVSTRKNNSFSVRDNYDNNVGPIGDLDEISISTLEEDKAKAIENAENRAKLEDKISNFDEIQTFISSDLDLPEVTQVIEEPHDEANDIEHQELIQKANINEDNIEDITETLNTNTEKAYEQNNTADEAIEIEEPENNNQNENEYDVNKEFDEIIGTEDSNDRDADSIEARLEEMINNTKIEETKTQKKVILRPRTRETVRFIKKKNLANDLVNEESEENEKIEEIEEKETKENKKIDLSKEFDDTLNSTNGIFSDETLDVIEPKLDEGLLPERQPGKTDFLLSARQDGIQNEPLEDVEEHKNESLFTGSIDVINPKLDGDDIGYEEKMDLHIPQDVDLDTLPEEIIDSEKTETEASENVEENIIEEDQIDNEDDDEEISLLDEEKIKEFVNSQNEIELDNKFKKLFLNNSKNDHTEKQQSEDHKEKYNTEYRPQSKKLTPIVNFNSPTFEDICTALLNISGLIDEKQKIDKLDNEYERRQDELNDINISSLVQAKEAKINAEKEKIRAEKRLKLAQERLDVELERQEAEAKLKELDERISRNIQKSNEVETEDIVLPNKVQTKSLENTEYAPTITISIPEIEKVEETVNDLEAHTEEKPRRGRPKGSKNKKTLLKEAMEDATKTQEAPKRRGRPKGSKNKRSLLEEK